MGATLSPGPARCLLRASRGAPQLLSHGPTTPALTNRTTGPLPGTRVRPVIAPATGRCRRCRAWRAVLSLALAHHTWLASLGAPWFLSLGCSPSPGFRLRGISLTPNPTSAIAAASERQARLGRLATSTSAPSIALRTPGQAKAKDHLFCLFMSTSTRSHSTASWHVLPALAMWRPRASPALDLGSSSALGALGSGTTPTCASGRLAPAFSPFRRPVLASPCTWRLFSRCPSAAAGYKEWWHLPVTLLRWRPLPGLLPMVSLKHHGSRRTTSAARR